MKIKILIPITISLLHLNSCDSLFIDENAANTHKENFNLLWQEVDHKYCFFQEKDIDWNTVYDQYAPLVNESMTEEAFFDVCANMLAELKDGHVNLSSEFNTARYFDWQSEYPQNFNGEIVSRKYLGKNYKIAEGLRYTIFNDSIGYIRYSSFMNEFSAEALDYMINYLYNEKGIIIDIRDNTGGYINLADMLASRFADKARVVGYTRNKKGSEHNDFSDYYEINLSKAGPKQITHIPVVVLTNRTIFSAANLFVNTMSQLPNVTLIGDKTGGGGGAPISTELYNGWQVNFSAIPLYNSDYKEIESGIAPDIKVDLQISQLPDSIDSMIEEARTFIKNK